MDQPDRSALWGGIGLVACCLAIVAGYMSLDDLRYWWWGQTTKARVSDFIAVNSRLPEEGATVWYEFVNPKNQRHIRASALVSVSARLEYPRGRDIDIEYIPGEFLKSRIRQTGSRLWPILFVVSTIATLACVITGFVTRRDEEEPADGEDEDEDAEAEAGGEKGDSDDEPKDELPGRT